MNRERGFTVDNQSLHSQAASTGSARFWPLQRRSALKLAGGALFISAIAVIGADIHTASLPSRQASAHSAFSFRAAHITTSANQQSPTTANAVSQVNFETSSNGSASGLTNSSGSSQTNISSTTTNGVTSSQVTINGQNIPVPTNGTSTVNTPNNGSATVSSSSSSVTQGNESGNSNSSSLDISVSN